ncbi:MAG: ADP-heptose synthase, biproductal sugar kinase/a denylyltransferase [Pseudomonadota bacterium]|jgi:D-beta-D-heptose 7-phosphate kinase/D-beta-D-heptose 1-phosphate adenosyltransferase
MVSIKKEQLLAVLDKIAATPIMVVGDLILDRYIWGKVDRISPEAPVPVVEVVKTEGRLGGAGNVVRNLATIGAKPSVCGLIGDDEDGRELMALFDEIGADVSGVVVDSARPTTLKTRVIAATQQIVRIDREKKTADSPEASRKMVEAINRSIDGNRAVILSDYGKGAVCSQVLDALQRASADHRLELSGRPLFVDPHPRNYNNYRSMSVAKPNRKEAEIASGHSINSIEDAFAAADLLMRKWNSEMMVITLGEDGMVVKQSGESRGVHLETMAQEVFDVSGAGDTVTALFCSALAVGASPTTAGVLANIAAGIVVSEVGTVAVDLERLRAQVQKWGQA